MIVIKCEGFLDVKAKVEATKEEALKAWKDHYSLQGCETYDGRVTFEKCEESPTEPANAIPEQPATKAKK